MILGSIETNSLVIALVISVPAFLLLAAAMSANYLDSPAATPLFVFSMLLFLWALVILLFAPPMSDSYHATLKGDATKVAYVSEQDEAAWLKQHGLSNIVDRKFDDEAAVTTLTARTAEDHLSTCKVVYDEDKGFIVKDGKPYAPAQLYCDGELKESDK